MQREPPDFGDGRSPQYGERDYTAFNRIMDLVHDAFLSRHGGLASEERWRWDIPVISFTWTNGQELNRSLNGHVLGEVRPTGIDIEANAWKDAYEGRSFIRYWRHFPAGRLNAGSMTYENIASFVERAYTEASSWTVEDLERRETLESSRENMQRGHRGGSDMG